MTIKEFIESYQALDSKFTNPNGKKLSEIMAETTSVWSNDAAKGYIIRAAQDLRMSREQIKEFLQRIEWTFDDLTVEEAEQIYNDY